MNRTISVVIPVRDTPDLLDAQLERVLGQKYEGTFETVIADNGSQRGVREVAARWAAHDPRVRWVDAGARRGPGAARNIGSTAATGEFLLFCDADDLVQPDWLGAIVTALESADLVAGYLDFTTLNAGPNEPPREATPHQFRYLPAGLGANLGVRRSLFEAVGGFDESLSAGEDIDLCWRIQRAGARFVSAPDAVVLKRERTDSRSRARQAMSYGRNDPALFRRHRSDGMPRNLALALKTWGWIVCNAPLTVFPRRRRTWLHATGLRAGRLVGCFEHRVIYP